MTSCSNVIEVLVLDGLEWKLIIENVQQSPEYQSRGTHGQHIYSQTYQNSAISAAACDRAHLTLSFFGQSTRLQLVEIPLLSETHSRTTHLCTSHGMQGCTIFACIEKHPGDTGVLKFIVFIDIVFAFPDLVNKFYLFFRVCFDKIDEGKHR